MQRQPKKTKYNKYFKPRYFAKSWSKMKELKPYSVFSLVAFESFFLNYTQLEAARQIIKRTTKRKGKLEICVLPDLGISNKSTSARMGKGKGKIKQWVASIPAGKVIFRLIGVSAFEAIPALKKGANKLPLKVKIY